MNFNPNFNPYFQQPQMQMQSQGLRLERIADLESAKKFQLNPNSTVYLLDESEPLIYIKQSDNLGKCSIRGFQITEIDLNQITDKRYVTRNDFDSFKTDILQAINNLKPLAPFKANNSSKFDSGLDGD